MPPTALTNLRTTAGVAHHQPSLKTLRLSRTGADDSTALRGRGGNRDGSQLSYSQKARSQIRIMDLT